MAKTIRNKLLGKVQEYSRRLRLLPEPGGALLLAVSGGADSMCMLSVMSEVARIGKFAVTVVHFNHGLRGEFADRDERFVREFCSEREIAFECGRPGAPLSDSSENAARTARYAYFAECAARHGGAAVAVAHNSDDNAETLLLQLARGAGALTGIAPIRTFANGLTVVRPLLNVTRAEIDAHLQAREIPHIEDETNADARYLRNRVRLEVMPTMREVNAKFATHALAHAETSRADDECLNALADEFLQSVRFSTENARLPRDEFNALHSAVASRVLIRVAERLGAHLYREHIDAAIKKAHDYESWRLTLPGNRLLLYFARTNYIEFHVIDRKLYT